MSVGESKPFLVHPVWERNVPSFSSWCDTWATSDLRAAFASRTWRKHPPGCWLPIWMSGALA